ncbi:type I DNA topoisomerase [Chloroflexota bacterium]
MPKKLVIVESPAKAQTLSRILGKGYSLMASIGHVRDLPKGSLGVDVNNSFQPKYVVPRAKSKVAKELKKVAKNASIVYLATDPDREGEAIAWHLLEVMKIDRIPYRRVTFHEISKEAIESAFKHAHTINMHLVNAQQARRVLDRLVGYKISPLLWKKVSRGLSAGRVQSIALKIVVDREREIEKFIPVEYWTVEAELKKKQTKVGAVTLRAILMGFFDRTKLDIHDSQEAAVISNELERAHYSVTMIRNKKMHRQPAPPFITSTLQQEAWRKLRFSAKQTMMVAQQLYEGLSAGDEGRIGLITYMRTDSTNVARSVILETREFIDSKYGHQFVPAHARYFTKRVKGAQEAHEAIRPTKIQREPVLIKPHVTTTQFKLYELIWKRMVASQMAAASFDNTTVEIKAECPCSKKDYLLRDSCSVIVFPGFIYLYTEGEDDEGQVKESHSFNNLVKDDSLELLGVFPEQHFTQPPPRFTEATLIKMLEQWGIGRPSTYVPILSTIRGREYVTKVSGSFKPMKMGFVVNDLLIKYFPNIVDIEFTANMENELDDISHNKRDWVRVIQDFYLPFEKDLQNATIVMDKVKLADEITDEICPKCGNLLAVKIGRYGKFLACSSYPECKYTKTFQIKMGINCPQCGQEIVQRINKKKHIFYGCSNFPNCNYVSNYRPLAQPCSRCGGLLYQYRKKWAKCTKCDYKGEIPKE